MAQETVRQLKQKAFMSFARNKAPRDIFSVAPGSVELFDEMHALGGYGPRVISTTSTSPAQSPESRVTSDSSQSPASSNQSDPPPANPSDDYPPQVYGNPVIQTMPPITPIPVVNIAAPLAMPYEWEKYDYASQLPTPSGNAVPTDFDNVFCTMGEAGTGVQPTPLQELGLGLGGEWQPVMDHFGL
jgi:hypothetical protein